MIVVAMSQITPSMSLILFVIQGLTGIDILRIAKTALPFFFLLLLAVVLITLFPQIVTFFAGCDEPIEEAGRVRGMKRPGWPDHTGPIAPAGLPRCCSTRCR